MQIFTIALIVCMLLTCNNASIVDFCDHLLDRMNHPQCPSNYTSIDNDDCALAEKHLEFMDLELKSVLMHEFGHALGHVHEKPTYGACYTYDLKCKNMTKSACRKSEKSTYFEVGADCNQIAIPMYLILWLFSYPILMGMWIISLLMRLAFIIIIWVANSFPVEAMMIVISNSIDTIHDLFNC